MFQDNPLLAQLKQQIRENIPKKEGVIRASDRGFGFLEVDEKTSYFVPPPYMKKVLHGDRVVALIRTEKEKEVAEPDELLEPGLTRFVARVKMFRDRLNVVPDHPLIKDAIKARPKKGLDEKAFQEGDWVVATLKRHALNDNGFFAEIIEKIADKDDHNVPWWVVLARHNLAQIEPADLPEWQDLETDLPRQDLTDVAFFTIDGPKTKDMDDALAIRETEQGWELLVAIADPTAYVPEGSELDKEAAQRAFTVYMPGRNVPMIPRTLSDELCSLKEGEVRDTLCARLTIHKDGLLDEQTEFFAARIRSHARLNYDDVSDLFEHDKPLDIDAAVLAQLPLMKAMTEARISWRTEHALVFPDRPDYDFELGENGEVLAIHMSPRRIANRMVEESMIAANICAGRVLGKSVGYGIFNVHTGFDEDSLDGAIELLKGAEAPFEKEEIATLGGFCALRRWIDDLDTRWLDGKIRRFQSYALMSSEPGAHFGLGLDAYATWTSPIRKYGDMVNHRLLKAVITGQQPGPRPSEELTQHLTDCRRLHRMVERDIADWLYARFLAPVVATDKVFEGEIIDVMRAGLKVRLRENGAVAFVPAKLILDNKDRLECNWDSGRVFLDKEPIMELGQTLAVKLAEVVEETRSIVAKPAVAIVPGPLPEAPAADTPAAE
ncbi:exoribonuclease II [Aeromonas simiae]|uniref:exoribonuclease II n=1 Tax=Aeromonas simiae TaxID=218936 RepID=UPI0005AACB21|nr:exoribonuclease II [Aeromonas simiae]MDO2949168.1 exoribonuclease II [Aeromonas simiae]MDO2952685.1 exoribonuclease II [Aeromonas simiae]MDO2956386.1 exoribonuclease II [Aeromonas simiae]